GGGAGFGFPQPAVSQHLRVLRESGFATVRADGSRRLYSVNPGSLDDAERGIAGVRQAWGQGLDALGTELARGARQRRIAAEGAQAGGEGTASKQTRRKR